MTNYNISKSILLKAENNYGLDTVCEVRERVEKSGIHRALEHFELSELYEHVKCLEFLYPESEDTFTGDF